MHEAPLTAHPMPMVDTLVAAEWYEIVMFGAIFADGSMSGTSMLSDPMGSTLCLTEREPTISAMVATKIRIFLEHRRGWSYMSSVIDYRDDVSGFGSEVEATRIYTE